LSAGFGAANLRAKDHTEIARMTRALMLTALLLASGSAAALSAPAYPHLMEFRDAMAAYEGGDHAVARAAFRHLAELGDPEARFNLGVMLLKGEGGEAEPVDGAAWARWALESSHPAATRAWDAIEAALSPEEREAALATLGELRARHDIASKLPKPPYSRAHDGCIAERMQRRAPYYPDRAARAQQIGYAVMHFLITPAGEVDAVHAMPSLVRNDQFADAATRAVRRWSARDCPAEAYRYATQVITFELDGGRDFTASTRKWADETLATARSGGAAEAYAVAVLDDLLKGLFGLEPGEQRELMLRAAVAGVPEARDHLAGWLYRTAPNDARRWRLLAARQGHAPALLWYAMLPEFSETERRAALLRAAHAGFLPAALLAVRDLALDPDHRRRDGAAALRITSALPESLLRVDPSMAQAHAAALAENGRFGEAAEWQQRALRTARRLGRDSTPFELRLQAYRDGRPWREPGVPAEAAAQEGLAASP
jgi:TPR repeat protein